MQIGDAAGNQSESVSAAAASVLPKRHLIITGSRGIGKSTLLREILALPYFSDLGPFPGFTTRAFPCDRVELTDTLTGKTARIGFYHPHKSLAVPNFSADNFIRNTCATDSDRPDAQPLISESSEAQRSGNQMTPDMNGFLGLGLTSITRAITSPSKWAVIDELGYLESSCPEFCNAVFRLFDKKQVIVVLRSQSTPFLDALRARDDVFVYDLDQPVLPVGCVIMASGLGKRFGSNKLMADFNGEPLISRILSATGGGLFAARTVVTRSAEVETFCREREIPVLLHAMPYRNHTVRLGLSALLKEHPELTGCMFALGDQPLLRRGTLEAMTITFSQYCRDVLQNYSVAAESETSNAKTNDFRHSVTGSDSTSVHFSSIHRLVSISREHPIVPGNPILFGNQYFDELLTLPDNHGGNVLLKKYPGDVRYFPADDRLELADADTPEELEQLKKAEFTR